MSEIPLERAPSDVATAARDAARGKVVYLMEDFADAQAAREALAEIEEGGRSGPG